MTAMHEHAVTDPEGPTGTLASWVADLTLDEVPRDVVERAKHLLLDGVGCALIGSQLPWSRVATGAVLDLENTGDVAVIGTGKSTSAPAAAVLNGTFIQGFELDDFHPIAPVHSCSLVIPALVSTAGAQPATMTGADFLLGAIAGFEVGPRVGYTLHGTQMLDRGFLDIIASGGVLPRLAEQGYLPAELGDVLRSSAVAIRGAGSGARYSRWASCCAPSAPASIEVHSPARASTHPMCDHSDQQRIQRQRRDTTIVRGQRCRTKHFTSAALDRDASRYPAVGTHHRRRRCSAAAPTAAHHRRDRTRCERRCRGRVRAGHCGNAFHPWRFAAPWIRRSTADSRSRPAPLPVPRARD
jgi:MmgE/PrpD N-terminal domain